MESKPSIGFGPSSSPLLSLSTFVHQHWSRLGAELATRFDEAKRLTSKFAADFIPPPPPPLPASHSYPLSLPFASVSQRQDKVTKNAGLSSDYVAKTLIGTSVYTVSNSNNEFVLISDPNGAKSIGLLCFRQEDAEAFLAQVRLRKGEVRGGAKVVPLTLDQVYMLKVEGITFRFLPDPVQVQNAIELKASDVKTGFDGVPVFQSDLLVVKKRNRRYCPIYFRKEDIEKELSSRASRGGASQHIMVGSLEDVLKKMEISQRHSGWEDLIFIPPGKSHSQHIQDVAKA
ncbi:protein TIC 22, chloroplastic [Nicotiana tabacum]|uniref:Protein TIC 22, chloroplastic n=1 Tax=Nicotiana tabacum TaxID=4097 RepID=A0A1S4ARA7_TOBAC|nr:PREDICTED: protein TIC 22, chloroplastic-like [Nicotiana tabacum]XP_016479281.1 PREDICTED: protein TIC 22, chloroplastic-like [Nicotiana tabacum]XP_016479282.1 PREDICTED: protein TIC 22, chloroplastic-like [Nicotiana tabacum]XP_016479283.1 PREDICTED: protein TIC 22, chloroplastic-like [Nicotiana tabacum]